MTDRPNVIMLGIDALRSDRTSLYGYDRPTTPVLDRLSRNAIVCRNAFSLAPFTQPASVQTFTSSRPLSYGGYDLGAIGRPQTIFERFHTSGYATSAVSTLHWVNRYFGYGEGLDQEYQLFTLNTVAGVAIAITRNSIDGFNKGQISAEDMLAVVEPVFRKLFRDCEDYCLTRIRQGPQIDRDFPDSLLVNAHYDFEKVRKVVHRHQAEFDADPKAYVERHLKKIPQAHEWLARDWYYCRKPGKLLSEAWVRLTNKLVRRIDPSAAILRQNRFKQYVDAEAVANKIIDLVEARPADKPFLIWGHFMDTHLPYVSGRGRRWWRETPRYLDAVGHDPAVDPARSFIPTKPEDDMGWHELAALYDASILWTDEQIGRIVDAVEKAGIAENTVIAVFGDHGEELGEHGNHSHYFLPYDHNVRIPMLFYRAGMVQQDIETPVSLLDIGPTVAGLAAVDGAAEWEGADVRSDAVGQRDHIVFETFYGGNCLFAERPLYLAVRTDRHKFIWKEYRDPKDWQSADGHELYDLAADPDEKTNLYRDDHPLVGDFKAIIAERLAELPEVSDDRIARGMAPAGAAESQTRPAAE